eukprot:gene666-1286_t
MNIHRCKVISLVFFIWSYLLAPEAEGKVETLTPVLARTHRQFVEDAARYKFDRYNNYRFDIPLVVDQFERKLAYTEEEISTLTSFHGSLVNRSKLVANIAMLDSSGPSRKPTKSPTTAPSKSPTRDPSIKPTSKPKLSPTRSPSREPSAKPTSKPSTSLPSKTPTRVPSIKPTSNPSFRPSKKPSKEPTTKPSKERTIAPSKKQSPSAVPSSTPTIRPSSTSTPSSDPTLTPSGSPSISPSSTSTPTSNPSFETNILQYQTFSYPNTYPAGTANWTSMSIAQNETHIDIAVFGSAINTKYTFINFWITGYLSDGSATASLKCTRYFMQGWNNELEWNYGTGKTLKNSDILFKGTGRGLELRLPKTVFPSGIVRLAVSMGILGYNIGLYPNDWSGASVSQTIQLTNLPTNCLSGSTWVIDGDPSDFLDAHSACGVDSLPRQSHWTVNVKRDHSVIYLDGILVASFYTPISTDDDRPLGVVGLKSGFAYAPKASTRLSGFQFYGQLNSLITVHFDQCRLSDDATTGHERRLTTVYASDICACSTTEDRIPASCPMYSAVESLYGHQFNIDPVMYIWTGVAGGVNTGAGGIFVPDFTFDDDYVVSHEMAHWTACAGGSCDYNTYIWLWEGLASFFGVQALNKKDHQPDFRYRPTLRLDRNITRNGPMDKPLNSYATVLRNTNGLQYTKGEMYFYVLCELTSYSAVHSVISNNYGKVVTSLTFIRDLEAISGKNLTLWLPGWLIPGEYYGGIGVEMSGDWDGDGLADFQEVLRGLDLYSADTDGDHYSDCWELSNGFDPKSASSPHSNDITDWVFDGIPYDFTNNTFTTVTWYDEMNRISKVLCNRVSDVITCGVWYSSVTAMNRRNYPGVTLFGDNYVAQWNEYGVLYNTSPYYFDGRRIPHNKVEMKETNFGMEFKVLAPIPGEISNLFIYKSHILGGTNPSYYILHLQHILTTALAMTLSDLSIFSNDFELSCKKQEEYLLSDVSKFLFLTSYPFSTAFLDYNNCCSIRETKIQLKLINIFSTLYPSIILATIIIELDASFSVFGGAQSFRMEIFI